MESEINKKIEDWEDEILLSCLRAGEMYYLESDKTAESWVSIYKANVIQKVRQLLKQEKEKLIHDHKILVNTILEKKNKKFKENGLKNPMKKSVWKIKKVCGNCGKPFVPDKEAMIFGTKKWDGHTFRFGCKCLKNKNIRISIG